MRANPQPGHVAPHMRSDDDAVRPLFAREMPLWLWIWSATQGAALCLAILVGGAGIATIGLAFAIAGYHAAGVVWYQRILRRPWAVLLYVPLGWALFAAGMALNPAFGFVIFGAIIQAFLFLPFAWAAGVLAIGIGSLCIALIARPRHESMATLLTRVAALVATGTTIGTILLYINRSNRDARIRSDLQRRLADQSRHAGVLEERQRLSRDLHDTLAQTIAGIARHLEAVDAEGGPSNDTAHLADARALASEALTEIRALLLALRPSELTEHSLESAIERVAAKWSTTHGVRIESSISPLPRLDADTDVAILRALQESLNNVARHAQARLVRVNLASAEGLVLLTVEDDGCGFDEHIVRDGSHLGLSGMRARIRRLGGHLLIDSEPGAGTSITIAVPWR